jgi:hypothetical protein
VFWNTTAHATMRELGHGTIKPFAKRVDLFNGQRRVFSEEVADGSIFVIKKIMLPVTQGGKDSCKFAVREWFQSKSSFVLVVWLNGEEKSFAAVVHVMDWPVARNR